MRTFYWLIGITVFFYIINIVYAPDELTKEEIEAQSLNEKKTFQIDSEKFLNANYTLKESYLTLHRKLLEGSLTNALDEVIFH